MGVSQAANLFQFATNQASRTVKSILGKGFQFDKVRSELHPKAVNILTLDQVKVVARALDRQGIEAASQFVDACLLEALERRFDNAFNVQRTEEERNTQLKARIEGKQTRRQLTDAIRDYLTRHPEVSDNHRKWMYSNASEAVNLVVFGKKAKKLCEELGVAKEDLRDRFDGDDLQIIREVENTALRMIDRWDIDPLEAIKQCGDRLAIA